ncbi:GNAT family N-acetyltransferase [Alkaliphilus hydrothermalis]|uniref:GNAT superfamily N-acetyltransferase n=1 Tax=Alkaliphilus hydrothermalis TaxID=1482730 RepID=A0ABS2NLA8_9FIRM|nr:GNAT family N-acetyltransferase [Alkaliphilus hydrothermalis]MBM7613717.1 GNAT superfamily N-acetyltransferase [Alkaliphilus hydrothermalis]
MKLKYTSEILNQEEIYKLYEALGWNDYLKLSAEELQKAMKISWYSIYVYHEDELIGTGRVVSDGVINGYLCGLGVLPAYRNRGIGKEISDRLVAECLKNNLHIQFFCEERLVPFYEKMGFKVFAIGMKMGD